MQAGDSCSQLVPAVWALGAAVSVILLLLLAWRVLFYALWHQIHRRGADPRQPLADILAEQA